MRPAEILVVRLGTSKLAHMKTSTSKHVLGDSSINVAKCAYLGLFDPIVTLAKLPFTTAHLQPPQDLI